MSDPFNPTTQPGTVAQPCTVLIAGVEVRAVRTTVTDSSGVSGAAVYTDLITGATLTGITQVLSTVPLQAGMPVFITGQGGAAAGGSSLPAGAATSAKQDTGNTSLATIATAVAAATPAGTNAIGALSAAIPSSAATSTDRSTTITTGGTAKQLMAANSGRKGMLIQNASAQTESIWFSELTTAVAASPSIEIVPGAFILFDAGGYVPTGAISVIAATSAHPICAREW